MSFVIVGRRAQYRVDTELGSGGVGVVYRGASVGDERKVAVKVLRDPSADADTRRRFEQEAALGATFNHPNIVRVLDTGTHDGCAFMVMELIEGENLEELLRRRVVPREAGVIIIARLARALDAAHRHGIVHRDVKPSNIIVTGVGEPVLMDFGFAKDLTTGLDLTGEFIVGTPNYMAPEQVQKKPITARVDIHALGVLLYAIATGCLPYHGKNVEEAFDLIVKSAPVPPRRIAYDVSPELEAVILRCLEKEPEKRYATAAELASVLEGIIARRLAAGGKETEDEGSAKRAFVLGGAIALAALLPLAWLLLRSRSGPPVAPAPAPPPAPLVKPPPPSPPPPASRPPVEKREPTDQEVCDAALVELESFRIRDAVAYLESGAQAFPRSARLQAALARALAYAGRREDALAAAQRAMEWDPTVPDPFGREWRHTVETRVSPRPPREREGWEPVGPKWEPVFGGEWLEKDGVIEARQDGTGPFWLAGLVRKDLLPSDRYRVSVELELARSRYLPYAGLIFGATSPDDFFAAYVFDAEKERPDRTDTEPVKKHREVHGSSLKLLRVARIQQGRWDQRGQIFVAFPDAGFVKLEVTSKGFGAVTFRVGNEEHDFSLERDVGGRVGILKYYEAFIRYRSFEYTDLR